MKITHLQAAIRRRKRPGRNSPSRIVHGQFTPQGCRPARARSPSGYGAMIHDFRHLELQWSRRAHLASAHGHIPYRQPVIPIHSAPKYSPATRGTPNLPVRFPFGHLVSQDPGVTPFPIFSQRQPNFSAKEQNFSGARYPAFRVLPAKPGLPPDQGMVRRLILG